MTTDDVTRILLIAVAILQGALSGWWMRGSKAGGTVFGKREEGIALSAAIGVGYLVYVIAALAYFIHPPWMEWSSVALPAQWQWLRLIGAVPLFAGAALSLWGLRTLGSNLTISISTKENHSLITNGPYRWMRHPLYSGGMIESLGVAVLMANWLVFLSAAYFWGLIVFRTSEEEEKLIAHFGDQYRRYAAQVGRFLPRRKSKR